MSELNDGGPAFPVTGVNQDEHYGTATCTRRNRQGTRGMIGSMTWFASSPTVVTLFPE